jgi:MIP family channel proteins
MGLVMAPTAWRRMKIKNAMVREFLAEFLATFTLMIFGLGANAMYVLSPALNSFLAVNVAWGFAVSLAIWISARVTGGHMNPAVSLSMALIGRLKWIKVPVYWLAQYVGAFVASATIYAVYHDALNNFDGGERVIVGENATAGIFATYPQPYVRTTTGLLDQVFGTMMLLLCVMAVGDATNMAAPPGVAPLCTGLVVTTIGMTLGMNCGYAINPARDFSPRLFTAIAGWGPQVFTVHGYWSWVPFVGPHLGAVLGSIVYLGLVGVHITDNNQTTNDDTTNSCTCCCCCCNNVVGKNSNDKSRSALPKVSACSKC